MDRYLLTFLLIALLTGCGGTALEVQQADDIPDGPGIFTKGEDGAVLYSSDRKAVEESGATAEKQNAGESADDFEQFKRWQNWKSAPESASEREEFEQWKKYQEYKKSRSAN